MRRLKRDVGNHKKPIGREAAGQRIDEDEHPVCVKAMKRVSGDDAVEVSGESLRKSVVQIGLQQYGIGQLALRLA